MILAFTAGLAALAATAAGLHTWRSARLAAHPETWPPGLSFARHLSLAKAFLKRDGWKLIEPQPAWNIFIRAQKDRVGLSLMSHTEETLSLPTLMKDCVLVSAPTGIIMGILSQQTLPPELQADAAGHGIFVVNPADLPDIATHIRRAAVRKKQLKEAGSGEPSLRSPSTTKVVSTA